MKPFDMWLEEKNPDICMACWGVGRGIFKGNFITCDIECPICKGSGKKNPELLKSEV